MKQSLDELLAKLARNKFNTIRLTVNHLSIQRNEAMNDYGDLDVAKNPWFAGNRYVSCPVPRGGRRAEPLVRPPSVSSAFPHRG